MRAALVNYPQSVTSEGGLVIERPSHGLLERAMTVRSSRNYSIHWLSNRESNMLWMIQRMHKFRNILDS